MLRLTPCYSSCALLMTCNLSSYQILTNSILFHWLLFIPIHRQRHAFPLSFLLFFYSSFPVVIFSLSNYMRVSFSFIIHRISLSFFFLSIYVCAIWLLFILFIFFSLTLHTLPFLCAFIQSLWNYIRCSVLHFPLKRTCVNVNVNETDGETKQIATIVHISFIYCF